MLKRVVLGKKEVIEKAVGRPYRCSKKRHHTVIIIQW